MLPCSVFILIKWKKNMSIAAFISRFSKCLYVQKVEKATMMVHTECRFHRVYNHLGDNFLDVSVREIIHRVNKDRKRPVKGAWHHSIGWDLVLYKRQKWVDYQYSPLCLTTVDAMNPDTSCPYLHILPVTVALKLWDKLCFLLYVACCQLFDHCNENYKSTTTILQLKCYKVAPL